MKTLSISAIAVLGSLSAAHAESSVLDQVAQLCAPAIAQSSASGGEKLGLKKSPDKPKAAFGETLYVGQIDGQTVELSIGDKFGAPLCDIYYPAKTEADYKVLRDQLTATFKTDGTVYDHPISGKTYLGQIWADSKAMDNGTVQNMTLSGIKAGSVFVQFSEVAFRQTGDRAGLMIEITGR